jgi:hypothetical protein
MIHCVSCTVRSPDGRTWRIERIRPESPLRLTRKEPFFWSSVVATLLLVAFAARMIWVDPGPLTLGIVIPLFLIWLLERDLNIVRRNIRAQTDGPPRASRTWRMTYPFGARRIEKRIAREVRAGREAEPPGTALIGI